MAVCIDMPILIETATCTGCRACEAACVLFHDGALGTSTARVRIFKDEPEGLDEPRLCRLCAQPACVPSCPEGALSQDPVLRTIRVDAEKCASCGACATACPFGSIAVDPRNGRPLFCDLCGGHPACVVRCSTGSLRWVPDPREREGP